MTGTIMTIEICSATRGSLTREETISANVTARNASSGPTAKTASSQRKSRITERRAGLARMTAAPTAKIPNAPKVARTAGMTAARHFPVRSSKVVIGVARSGSSERVVFSPTTE